MINSNSQTTNNISFNYEIVHEYLGNSNSLLEVINKNQLDNETTLLIDLINDCAFWENKCFKLKYMSFTNNLNCDGSTNLKNLNLFQESVIAEIVTNAYTTIVIEKTWVLASYQNKNNILLDEINRICNNSNIRLILTYDRENDLLPLLNYSNLRNIISNRY